MKDALMDDLMDDLQPLHGATLVRQVLRHAPADGIHPTALAPLQLVRTSAPGAPLPAVYEPGLAIVVQGRKQARLADELITYDPLHCLLVSVTMLPVGQVIEASPQRPYLCIRLQLDLHDVSALMLQTGAPAAGAAGPVSPRGIGIARVSPELLDAMTRLLQLLDQPAHAPVLAPLALREIHYRLLTCPTLGPRLRQLALAGSPAQRIARAIDLLQRRYAEPVRVEELADAVHMSASALHHHFKQVTSMSPLQFQKQLRLHQARRLMLADGLDAAAAGHRVGYESPSQFSREYRRLFGAPPRTEVQRMRQAAA
jgi:AraC-like DNA-binding protein